MKFISTKLCLLIPGFILFCQMDAASHERPEEEQKFTLRADCIQPIAKTELNINNVRAKLLNAGDFWWDLQKAGYTVPKNLGVSTIFAAGLWMGGYDPIGNLKVAAQTYRRQTSNDYWSGPLDPDGQVDALTCENWDRFFEVKGEEIYEHMAAFRASVEQGISYTVSDIPASILGWPAKGNPHFFEIHGFHLPEDRGIAAFYDYNDDGLYDPIDGDYPVLKRSAVNSGGDHFLIPDQMISWVFNDNGGIHTSSYGIPIQMEVQATSFAYTGKDEINETTFQQLRFLYKGSDDLKDFYAGLWVDPDLGCYQDDYIGCDTAMNLMYVYNKEEFDGINGCECSGIPTYCDNIPLFGIRILDGLKYTSQPGHGMMDMGLSSFAYYRTPRVTDEDYTPPYFSCFPYWYGIAFYRVLQGLMYDGTPYALGGTGFNPSSTQNTKYTFPSSPDDQSSTAWSMCSEHLPRGDYQFIGSSGPVTFEPGGQKELLFTNLYVPSQKHPCPSIKPLQYTAEMAEVFLFDQAINDGIIPEGPEPPDLMVEEWSDRITLRFSNEATSNNYMEQYTHPIPSAAAIRGEETELYRFEGYRVFQVVHDSVQAEDLNNPDIAIEVFQCDIANGVETIFNWKRNFDNPALPPVFYTELMVDGQDKGIESTFILKNDAFTGEKFRLNGTYHFVAMAYAWNNYADVGPETGIGQRKPYLQGNISRLTLFNDEIKTSSAKLYPSMITSGNSNLWLENVPGHNKILLLNSQGHLIKSWQFLEYNDRISITIPSDLAPGLYYIQIVKTNQTIETLRFLRL